MNILVVKTGALGDVVRTQFFAKFIFEQRGCNVHWLTSPESEIILRGNEFIENVYTNFSEIKNYHWDHVYSLEDDEIILSNIAMLNYDRLSGLITKDGVITYTPDTSVWNNMGIHSTFGIKIANTLKIQNKKSHLEIFSDIFQVSNVIPNWKGVIPGNKKSKKSGTIIGCNMFAGKRWPNKSASSSTIKNLLKLLEADNSVSEVRLIGSHTDWAPYALCTSKSNYYPTDTIDNLAEVISTCDYLITCDSLAVHLSAAVGTPYICFFGPTSAEEIKVPNVPYMNIISDAPGYCSYSPKAQITGIDAKTIYASFNNLKSKLG